MHAVEAGSGSAENGDRLAISAFGQTGRGFGRMNREALPLGLPSVREWLDFFGDKAYDKTKEGYAPLSHGQGAPD